MALSKSSSTLTLPSGLEKNDLINSYRLMQTSRALDRKMLILLKQGKSFFHIGCMGHEAIQAAGALVLQKKHDWLFPYYRDQTFCLGMGQTPLDCFLAFLARGSDPNSGGRQMPQHYGDKRYNIPTSSSSTGTQFLQAVGNAFASMREFKAANINAKKTAYEVSVVCSGDGTTSQGEFHEALSWATREKAPVIFLVENNGYAISVPLSDQRPSGSVLELGKGYPGLLSLAVDGCDFIASFDIFKRAVTHARLGQGPCLIDASVVRLLPHSSSDDDKKYRNALDLEKEKSRDPISLLKDFLLTNKIATAKQISIIDDEVHEAVEKAAAQAEQAAMPTRDSAMNFVWSDESEPVENEVKLDKDAKEYVVVDAINRALAEELAANEKVMVFGQDVAKGKGGVFTATRGLTEKFGDARCFNAPLAEASIVGVAIGLAMRGFRPVPEIQFGDYIWTAMMQIRNELATVRYRSNNAFECPVVIRVPVGGYIHGALCHSQNIEATFAHIPGLKIALPSTAIDAYGLLKRAIRGRDPVLFLEHKALYRQAFAKSFLPTDDNFEIPFGKAAIRRTGNDLTIISYGILVQKALEAARICAEENIDVEVIDLRTIRPYDWDLIAASTKKTGKVLVLYEDNRFMGFGAELAAEISEQLFDYLDGPVMRLAGKDSPIAFNWDLEEELLPQMSDILTSIKKLHAY